MIVPMLRVINQINDQAWSPGLEWRTVPRQRHYCVRVMASCAWEGLAEHLDNSSRKQVRAVVQMVEIAQFLVGAALERECPVA